MTNNADKNLIALHEVCNLSAEMTTAGRESTFGLRLYEAANGALMAAGMPSSVPFLPRGDMPWGPAIRATLAVGVRNVRKVVADMKVRIGREAAFRTRLVELVGEPPEDGPIPDEAGALAWLKTI